ncbi:MAG: hypothetical protein F6K30_04420 [Cyanothece sp. SIO2G6]|nr:hypothetical protein [Cyanothece sp. SIO2G6]
MTNSSCNTSRLAHPFQRLSQPLHPFAFCLHPLEKAEGGKYLRGAIALKHDQLKL